MGNQTLVKVAGLSRYYAHHVALRELSFTLEQGEVLGFLGPNGAGKTTTMQLLTGNLAPTAGSIEINGIDLLEHPKNAKRAIGYLPEQPPVYNELTVDEYLNYCAAIHRVARHELTPAREKAKSRCGLSHIGHRLIANLSKGYRQRVGIAQAIIHNPAVVILDEPTAGLDPIQIRDIRALISELGLSHSVIISSHILPEIQAVCSRVQIINHGELVLSDTIDGLSAQMRSNSLIVGAYALPPRTTLQALDNIERVDIINAQHARLHFSRDHNPAEAIAAQAVTQGWRLFSLAPERRTLEDIFIDLTQDEPAQAQS